MAVRLKDRIEANIRQSDKVNSSLSIQLNSGTATVYDGSTARSINITPAAIGAVKKSGDTLTLASNLYEDNYSAGALHLANSNIDGINAIYFCDAANVPSEAIHFYRSATTTDTIWAYNGVLYFIPNRTLGSENNVTAYTVLHSNNYTSYTVTKTGSGASGTWGINISGNATTATALSSEISNNRLPIRLRENTSGTSANPDTFMSSGFYYTSDSGILNVDDANILTIAHTKNGWCHQLGFKFNGGGVSGVSYDGADIYTRIYNNANSAWRSWYALLSSGNYTAYTVTKTGGGASGTWGINITGNASTATALTSSAGSIGQAIYFTGGKPAVIDWRIGNSSTGEHDCNNIAYNFCGYYTSNGPAVSIGASTADGALYAQAYSSSWVSQIAQDYRDGDLFVRGKKNNAWTTWKKVWVQGDAVTGAVWNDYAEFRESTTTKPGLVVFENGDDTLSSTIERLSHFAGVISDTWGFCQGETERAKTPIAVAGRVLAYPFRDRNEYKPGDCVCAAPNGTIDIMTREEVERYPDRIVGTVSCVPEYEEWGSGDRPAVKVNGRIWIKVR